VEKVLPWAEIFQPPGKRYPQPSLALSFTLIGLGADSLAGGQDGLVGGFPQQPSLIHVTSYASVEGAPGCPPFPSGPGVGE